MPKNSGFLKLFVGLLILVVLIAGIVASVILVGERHNFLNFAATPKVILNLVPGAIYLDKDQSATIQVIINTQDTFITAADIHLRYDPNIITVDQINSGKFFSSISNSQINNGEVIITLSSDVPRNGLGILAQLRIRSLVKAPTEIIFSKSTSVTPDNLALNAVSQTYGAKIYDDESKVPKSIGNSTIPEGVVYTDPDSFIRQLTEPRIEDAALKQQEVKPGFSAEYVKYLLSLPFQQINKLNKNLEKKVGEFIK